MISAKITHDSGEMTLYAHNIDELLTTVMEWAAFYSMYEKKQPVEEVEK